MADVGLLALDSLNAVVPAAVYLALVRRLPRRGCGIGQQDAYRLPVFGVCGDGENEFRAAFTGGAKGPVTFVKILIHVTALRRIGLEPADGRGTGQSYVLSGEKTAKHA